ASCVRPEGEVNVVNRVYIAFPELHTSSVPRTFLCEQGEERFNEFKFKPPSHHLACGRAHPTPSHTVRSQPRVTPPSNGTVTQFLLQGRRRHSCVPIKQ